MRAGLYRLLAVSFLQPDAAQMETLQSEMARALLRQVVLIFPQHHLGKAVGLFQAGAGEASLVEKAAWLQERAQEYCRLFVGPGPVLAPPYGSVYLDGGVVMGPSTLAARRAYQRESLTPALREPPDHIAIELGFLGSLCERQSLALAKGDITSAWHHVRSQHSFLKEHLARWVGVFAAKILAATNLPLYRSLALLVSTWVAFDRDLLGSVAQVTARKG